MCESERGGTFNSVRTAQLHLLVLFSQGALGLVHIVTLNGVCERVSVCVYVRKRTVCVCV